MYLCVFFFVFFFIHASLMYTCIDYLNNILTHVVDIVEREVPGND